MDAAGDPRPGVRVTVLKHPEYGYTLTRADGTYDLAVNAPMVAILDFSAAGLLPAQRTVRTRAVDFVEVPDVGLLAVDPVFSTVAANAETGQLTTSSAVTDADGTRQARVYFPANTGAAAHLADGSTVPLGMMTVRATEYTVGSAGQRSMPGTLPPTSAYTYAVELSVDEAMAMGATDVEFSDPVYTYVDNFLGLPVGGAVPAGYYDRGEGRWVASDNGRIIEVLGIEAGLAQIDLDGDGLEDAAADRAALGLTDAERGAIAAQYGPGAELWR
ncbi:MAG: hypothetical protein AAFU70_14310, partial [Planctomycetota bacterium]